MSSLFLFPESLFEQDFTPRRRPFSCAPCTPADAFHPYSRAPADPFAWFAAAQEQAEAEERRRRRQAAQLQQQRLEAALRRQYEVELELQHRAEIQRRAAERQRQRQLALQAQRERQRAQELARRRQAAIEAARHEEAQYLSNALEGLFTNFFGSVLGDFYEEPVASTSQHPVASTSKVPLAPTPVPIEREQAPVAEEQQQQEAAPVEVDPIESTPGQATTIETTTDHLLLKHPYGSVDASAVRPQDIDVSVDNGKVKVTGLWAPAAAPIERPSSPARGRSLSPKRPRVRDVDEDGNEVLLPEDEGSDAGSDAGESKSNSAAAQQPFSVTLDLPQNAKVDSIRANLTDEGFELWVSA